MGAQPANQPPTVSQTASFGPVIPGRLGTPAAVLVPFRLPISKATAMLGYRVTASASFAFTPTAPEAGGKSVTAADIGVGITSVSSTLGGNGNAVIDSGFAYDPAAAKAASGSSAFTGATNGRATLADLIPGREVLRAGKAAGVIPVTGGDLTVTVTIAVPTQFFTPGSFSGTVTLIVSQ